MYDFYHLLSCIAFVDLMIVGWLALVYNHEHHCSALAEGLKYLVKSIEASQICSTGWVNLTNHSLTITLNLILVRGVITLLFDSSMPFRLWWRSCCSSDNCSTLLFSSLRDCLREVVGEFESTNFLSHTEEDWRSFVGLVADVEVVFPIFLGLSNNKNEKDTEQLFNRYDQFRIVS